MNTAGLGAPVGIDVLIIVRIELLLAGVGRVFNTGATVMVRLAVLSSGLLLTSALEVASALVNIRFFVDVAIFLLAALAGPVTRPHSVLIVSRSGFVHFLKILGVFLLALLARIGRLILLVLLLHNSYGFKNSDRNDAMVSGEAIGLPPLLQRSDCRIVARALAAKAGCAVLKFVKGVTSGDYDSDGLPDISKQAKKKLG